MVVARLRVIVGGIVMAISAAGLFIAIGNLVSLPSIQRQLQKTIPTAEPSIAEAIAISRKKTYIGIGILSGTLIFGIALFRYQRRKPADESSTMLPR